MEKHDLTSWDDFISTIQDINNEYSDIDIMWRGVPNSEWKLTTTLERFNNKNRNQFLTLSDYIYCICRCAPQIESFTGRSFNLPPEANKIIKEIEHLSWYTSPQISISILHLPSYLYDYCTYLRHHGFPSPLLDWSMSPYIAAFFAFADDYTEAKSIIPAKVSIYGYIEGNYLTGKKYSEGNNLILTYGPNIKAHERHFLQQTCYSMALRHEFKHKIHTWTFVNHEEIVHRSNENADQNTQDLLIEITLPYDERIKALTYLNAHNINHFSLLQSEDSLMKAIIFKELITEKKKVRPGGITGTSM